MVGCTVVVVVLLVVDDVGCENVGAIVPGATVVVVVVEFTG